MDLINKIPTKNGGGGHTPKHETLYRSRAPAGLGEERRKNAGRKAGRPKAVNQGSEISPKNPDHFTSPESRIAVVCKTTSVCTNSSQDNVCTNSSMTFAAEWTLSLETMAAATLDAASHRGVSSMM
ncbi:hypothetical protein TNCV_3741481 [Trichonephila clavipes]|nr:hypothetical protein TNCV_3741481 [Trichonephila clavipes]